MTTATTQPLTLEATLDAFLRSLDGKNRSAGTRSAYKTDLTQFITWVHGVNVVAETVDQVEKVDIIEYLGYLSQRGLTGVSRARKIAAIREYFRFLEALDYIPRSPATGVETPKREKTSKTWLRPEEYTKLLSLAGANPRDYAILQVFLQTGIRVSELCDLRLDDVDFDAHVIRVRGKGQVTREIDLEPKGIKAVKNWLKTRAEIAPTADYLFLNRYGEPIGERGVKKLMTRYRTKAGITKKAGCHSLRHTFATHKAEKGVSPFQIQEWLGHANLNTTQIYVHLGKRNGRKVMEATSL